MAFEDYTTYTKVDPNNRFTVTPNQITITGLTRNESAYIYKDSGVNYYSGACVFDVTTEIGPSSGTSSLCTVWGMSNSIGDRNMVITGGGDEQCLELSNISGSTYLALREIVNGSPANATTYAIPYNSLYYLRIVRTAANGQLICYIYSDSARTNLQNSISITLSAAKSFRYIYAAQSYNSGSTVSLSGDARYLAQGVGFAAASTGISRGRALIG